MLDVCPPAPSHPDPGNTISFLRRHPGRPRAGERGSPGAPLEGDRVPEVPPTVSCPAPPSPSRRSILWLALACLTLAAGCNRPHPPDVVASVNGHPIDQATLERY